MRRKRVLLLLVLPLPVLVFLLLEGRTLLPPCSLLPTPLPQQQQLQYNSTTPFLDDCHPGQTVYEDFCVYSPYEATFEPSEDSLTLSTQGTAEFLHHLVVVCSRWRGPISVAVYIPTAPDQDEARALVSALRRCHSCVRRWVSWHFFHRKGHATPDMEGTTTPAHADEDCESFLLAKRVRKRPEGDTYPINVGRNLARSRSRTPYVFATDIELYPSTGLLSKFERMLATRSNRTVQNGRQVWVVPVFEVAFKYRAPVHKAELRAMFDQKRAVSFHRFRCNVCHQIPNLTQWMHAAVPASEVAENLEPLRVWQTVKRSRKFGLDVWEPFFIGSRTGDPEFDIRLSWEGKQNKMQVAFEMCILDYDFHIVENAFLVHSPGINVFNATKDKFREKYARRNNELFMAIRKDLFSKHPDKKGRC